MSFPRFFPCCTSNQVSPAKTVIMYCAFPGVPLHPKTIPNTEDIIDILKKTFNGTTIGNIKILGIAKNGIEKKHLFSSKNVIPDSMELFHTKYAYLEVEIPLDCVNDEKICIDINNIMSILDNNFSISLSRKDLLRYYSEVNSTHRSFELNIS